MAFRKTFRDEEFNKILSIEGILFDVGVATIAAMRKQLYVLNENLVFHRIHTKNTSTGYWTPKSRIKDIDRQIASRQAYLRRLKSYYENYQEKLTRREKRISKNFILFLEKRIIFLKKRMFWRCFFQSFHFNRMNTLLYLIVDCICILYNK